MSILSKFQAMRDRTRARAIIRAAENRSKPLFALGATILKATITCAEILKSDIDPDHRDKYVLVCFEFAYFFMHLANRSAFANLGQKGRTALQKEFGSLMVKGVVAAFLDHWPEERKLRIEREFLENLNKAELEYAECNGLFSKEEPLTGDSLISTLARNVAASAGRPLDLTIMVNTTQTVAAELVALNLDALVKTAGKELDV